MDNYNFRNSLVPYVIEQTGHGERSYDIFSRLLKDRIVFIDGEINDTMKYVKCDIQTICMGQAASMAAILLAGGTKGKRYALPSSRIMIHQPRGGVEGQESDISILAKEIIRLKKLSIEYLSNDTGKSVEKIAEDIERDFFMSAQEGKDYGIVDHVMPNRK